MQNQAQSVSSQMLLQEDLPPKAVILQRESQVHILPKGKKNPINYNEESDSRDND